MWNWRWSESQKQRQPWRSLAVETVPAEGAELPLQKVSVVPATQQGQNTAAGLRFAERVDLDVTFTHTHRHAGRAGRDGEGLLWHPGLSDRS